MLITSKSSAMRLLLILISIGTLVFVITRVRNSRIRISDSVFWVCIALLLLVISIFPQIVYYFTDLLGMMSPINLVFLLFIFILLIKCFSLSVRMSQADSKIEELTQQLAIERFERHQSYERRHGPQ